MKRLYNLAAALLSTALLAACGELASSTPMSASAFHRQAASVRPFVKRDSPTLYVLNSGRGQAFTVTVYRYRGASLLRSLSLGKYGQGIVVDPAGHLYVGVPFSQGDSGGTALLNIYANRGGKLVQTGQQPHPFGLLTLDAAGNFYTLCAADRLCEYAPGGSQVLEIPPIRKSALRQLGAVAHALAVDGSGNLAVSSAQSVLVFAPGATTPYWSITGIAAGAIVFDASGDLYVAVNTGSTSIEVYAPGGTSPIRTITNGIVNPTALDFDGSGNLYVLNDGIVSRGSCTQAPAVTVYSPGGATPMRTITAGLVCGSAHAMSLDSSAYVYVSNGGFPGPGNVVVYPPTSNSPKRTVIQGIQNPQALAIGP